MRNNLTISATNALYLLCFITIVLVWYGVSLGLSPSLDFVIIGLTALFIITMNFRNLAHVMFMVGFLVFVVMPVVSIHDLIFINAELVLSLCFSTLLFLWLTRNCSLPISKVSLSVHPVPILAGVILIALGLIAVVGISGLLVTPLVLVSFFFLVQGAKFNLGLIMLSMVFAHITIFGLFLWSGFGRLILASWLLAALWIFWYRYGIPFGKLIVFAPILGGEYILAAFGSTRRAFAMREQILTGSVGSDLSPFLLANDFANSMRSVDVRGLLDQFVLYFLQWVPRMFWPEKPLGFGFEYTVQNYGPGMVAAGHSIAALHVGEHLYYLNDIGFATSFLTIMLVAASYRFLLKHNARAPFLAIVFAMYLPTFVWGGMSAFMSRVWVGILIVIFLYVFIWLLRVFMRSSFGTMGRKSA